MANLVTSQSSKWGPYVAAFSGWRRRGSEVPFRWEGWVPVTFSQRGGKVMFRFLVGEKPHVTLLG